MSELKDLPLVFLHVVLQRKEVSSTQAPPTSNSSSNSQTLEQQVELAPPCAAYVLMPLGPTLSRA